MDKNVGLKIIDVQERLLEDETYLRLLEEYRIRDAAILEVLNRLPCEEQAAVVDYLGLVGEMHRKMLETALS